MIKTVFSGIQPTGDIQLGNYIGAISNWVDLQKQDYNNIYCIVDLHAITTYQDPKILHENILKMGALLIASGIDYNKSTLFVQSYNRYHTELAWIINCVARMGWLKRMTQFKDKSGKNQENVSVGLFAYPNLQTADILLYDTHLVPVGEDQKQHIELCRDTAQKFNNDYGVDCFTLPEHLTYENTGRIMSLQDGTKKMSKSDPSENSKILFTDSNDLISKKISRAKTDAFLLPSSLEEAKQRPEVFNLLSILAFCKKEDVNNTINMWHGKGFKEFKDEVTERLIALIAPIREKQAYLLNDKNELQLILNQGGEKAIEQSTNRIKKVKEIIGIIN